MNKEVGEYDLKFAREAYFAAKQDHSIPAAKVAELLRTWVSLQAKFNMQLIAQRPSRHVIR